MDQVKALLAEGKVTAEDLMKVAKCAQCCEPLSFDEACKDQRSDSWHKARGGRITASDCAAICVIHHKNHLLIC